MERKRPNKKSSSFSKSKSGSGKSFGKGKSSSGKPGLKNFSKFIKKSDAAPFKKDKKGRDEKFDRDNKFEKPKRNYSKSNDDKYSDERKSEGRFDKKERFDDGGERKKSFEKKEGYSDRSGKRSYSNDRGGKKPFERREGGGKEFKKREYSDNKDSKRSFERKDSGEKKQYFSSDRGEKKTFEKRDKDSYSDKKRSFSKNKSGWAKSDRPQEKLNDDGTIRLNKYLANAGIASRRDADTLIQGGTVKVNGVVVDQLGYKVKPGDVVTYGDSAVKTERKVYLLLNKPKDFLTTTDDPQERRTVMELVRPACRERIYPVGRLDRQTTGLLLFTNDGDLATKLMHPKYLVRKLYHVTLNKPLKAEDFETIANGFELEDGFIKVDDIAYVGPGRKELGVEIHSGKNRIVRRIFEHFDYEVYKLDRVTYAGLTKKDLPRGKYRFLTEKEIAYLKMLK